MAFASASCARFATILFVAALLLSRTVSAAIAPGVRIQAFGADQGLPPYSINSIVQSPEGYLLLATLGGLVRFDGVTFKVFNSANTPELPNSRITALHRDSAGTIWIGHETGDLSRLKDGRFESVAIPGASYPHPVIAMSADDQGAASVFYQDAALRNVLTGEILQPAIPTDPQLGATASVRDGTGALWVLQAGSLSRVVEGNTKLIELDRFAADQQVYGIGAARDGGVWIASRGAFRKRVGDEWRAQLFPPFTTTAVTSMLELRDGALAVGTAEGIFLVRPNELLHLDRKDGLPPDWVRTMCEDSEGNLWAGLGSGGLVVLRPGRAGLVETPDRWKGRTVVSVAPAASALWIGTEGAGLIVLQTGVAPLISPTAL